MGVLPRPSSADVRRQLTGDPRRVPRPVARGDRGRLGPDPCADTPRGGRGIPARVPPRDRAHGRLHPGLTDDSRWRWAFHRPGRAGGPQVRRRDPRALTPPEDPGPIVFELRLGRWGSPPRFAPRLLAFVLVNRM